METGDLLHAVRLALDTTYVGPGTGYVAAIFGIARVCLPIIREWIASRAEKQLEFTKDGRTPSFRLAYELAVQQTLENHAAWERERLQLLAQQTYLLAKVKALEAQLNKDDANED